MFAGVITELIQIMTVLLLEVTTLLLQARCSNKKFLYF